MIYGYINTCMDGLGHNKEAPVFYVRVLLVDVFGNCVGVGVTYS